MGGLYLFYLSEFAVLCAECGEWYVLDDPWVHHSIARFGHSAVVHDNKMYVFGGFNGVVLGDVFVYEPGKVSIIFISLLLYACMCVHSGSITFVSFRNFLAVF